MIVLDTNVVSEAMKPKPNPQVKAWLNAQPYETLYLSSVTLAEMFFGINTLPNGKRKEMLNEALNDLIALFAVSCHLILLLRAVCKIGCRGQNGRAWLSCSRWLYCSNFSIPRL